MPDEYKLKVAEKVNNPLHYNKTEMETIDIIKNAMEPRYFHGYLQGNIMKYVCRYKYKGSPTTDLKKAQWYLNRLILEMESGE
jgi:hypothetical protein|tara:strand:- start:577 stop:825 length:249 start_codon:yes stop_codon:yes gene_type:complete